MADERLWLPLRRLRALHSGCRHRPHAWSVSESPNNGAVVVELRELLASSQFLPAGQQHVQAALQQVRVVTELASREATVSVFGSGPQQQPPSSVQMLAALDVRALMRAMDRVRTLFSTCDVEAQRRARGLRILILPLAAPRMFPSAPQRELVGPKHLNGGFYVPSRRLIVITRAEEYAKVLLHETIHHLMGAVGAGHDEYAVPPGAMASLKAALHVAPRTRLLLDEAVTETLAVVCHCAFLAMEASSDDADDAWMTVFEGMLKQEVSWCGAIVGRLAHMYDWPARPWREATNAFCYLFLRYALMQDLSAFAAMWRSPTAVCRWLTQHAPARLSEACRTPAVPAGSLRMTRFGNDT